MKKLLIAVLAALPVVSQADHSTYTGLTDIGSLQHQQQQQGSLHCASGNSLPRCAKTRLVLDHEGRLNDLEGGDLSLAAEMDSEMRDQRATNLAFDSIQILLPQKNSSRLTFNLSGDGDDTGGGLGYAYMFEGKSRVAIFTGIGVADDARVGKLGISFEF